MAFGNGRNVYVFNVCERIVLSHAPLIDPGDVFQRSNPPPLRNQPQIALFELAREECRRIRVHAPGLTALRLRPYRVEVHEPRLEQRPRHRFQRLVHPPVQLNLVVERAQNGGDGVLLVTAGEVHHQLSGSADIEVLLNSPHKVRTDV